MWYCARTVLALALDFGRGLGFASFIRSVFFGFKINDWSYYMYNLVNATKMLKEKLKWIVVVDVNFVYMIICIYI